MKLKKFLQFSLLRYEQLMKIRCSRKLLLTGTPLQNNLVELMSLLIFVMPGMFAKRKDQLKKMFSLFPKSQDDSERSNNRFVHVLIINSFNFRTHYEKDRIAHAKRIMKPFFLRRLKVDVRFFLFSSKVTWVFLGVDRSSRQGRHRREGPHVAETERALLSAGLRLQGQGS